MSVASHHRPRQPADRLAHDERGAAQALPAAHGEGRVPRRLRDVRARRRLRHLPTSPAAPGRTATSWVITGNKYWCTFADGADFIIVIARTVAMRLRASAIIGLSMFFVEKKRGELPKGVHRRADSQDRLLRLEDLGARLRRLPRAGERHARRGRQGVLLRHRRPRDARAPIPRRARSASRRARSRMRSPTPASASSSASRSPTSRRSASRSPRWRPRSRRRASCIYFVCEQIDTGQRCDKEASMVKLFASEMAERVTQRGAADPRRRRLHHAACRRALLARRAAHQDLRGHLGDPAAHHLRPPARPREELMKVSALTGTDNYFEDFKSAT